MIRSSWLDGRFPSYSFFLLPAAAIISSRSAIHTRSPDACARLSAYDCDMLRSPPIGEYFFKIIPSSPSVYISKGLPSCMRSTFLSSLGITTRPRESTRLVSPVAFIHLSSKVIFYCQPALDLVCESTGKIFILLL